MQKVFDTVEEFWSIKDFNKIKNHASENSLPYFKRELSNYLEVDQKCLHFTPSAHKGLELLLSSVESYDRKVLAPAFNCPVVEDAIKNSGWGVELYDFSTKIGFFDWDDLIDRLDKDIGIVVITHYFGVPQNFLKIKDRCKDLGILIIEDCAHTLGGKINGMMAGTIGDASVFSFNYDKPISLGWGGLVIVNNQNKFKNLKTNRWLIPSIKEELFLQKIIINKNQNYLFAYLYYFFLL